MRRSSSKNSDSFPLPVFPIFIPSKGRAEKCLTADFLEADDIPFRLVVEPQEFDAYAARYTPAKVLSLPFRNLGSVVPARNWIKKHATDEGAAFHWQIDDNIRSLREWAGGKRRKCSARMALWTVERFIDRFENVAIAGLRHQAFGDTKPFSINRQVYCCVLVDNQHEFQWRGKRAEDTDYSLQVLTSGLCTILINAYLIEKASTGKMRGGNTDTVYQGDGKLEMVREMQRRWPRIVTLTRRYGIPRMNLPGIWRKFSQRPILKGGAGNVRTESQLPEIQSPPIK